MLESTLIKHVRPVENFNQSEVRLRDISLTTGGGDRHVRQNSPEIFCDPPYQIGMEIGDPPHLNAP